jgi:hypothetical protein
MEEIEQSIVLTVIEVLSDHIQPFFTNVVQELEGNSRTIGPAIEKRMVNQKFFR